MTDDIEEFEKQITAIHLSPPKQHISKAEFEHQITSLHIGKPCAQTHQPSARRRRRKNMRSASQYK